MSKRPAPSSAPSTPVEHACIRRDRGGISTPAAVNWKHNDLANADRERNPEGDCVQNGNLGLMSTRPTPAPAPSTPAAAVAVSPSSATPSEAPTILSSDDDEAAGPLSLQRRAPPVKKVIEAVMDCDALKPFLSLAAGSLHAGDLQLFSGEAAMEVWGHVADLLCDGVEKFTPMVEKDLPKKTAAFAKYKQKIINNVVPSKASTWFGVDLGGSTTTCARSIHVTSLLGLITMHFIRYFLDMMSSPSGDNIAPICDQVDGCVSARFANPSRKV